MTGSHPLSRLADPSLLRTQAYVDGLWIDADDARTFDVVDPATGDVLAAVPLMGGAETRRAIEAAERAQRGWRAQSAAQRATILKRWFELMLAHTADLATIMSAEQGKPFAEAKGEIAYAASFVEWFAEQGKRVDGDVLASPHADKRMLVVKEPVGVCAAIT